MLSLLWAGLLIGVSFLATPVKFQAETLSRPAALDVGRETFHLLNKVEIGLSIALLIIVGLWLARTSRRLPILALAGLIVVIVAAQTLWLLPGLDPRVEAIIEGRDLEWSPLHLIYIGGEVAKLSALLLIAVATWRS